MSTSLVDPEIDKRGGGVDVCNNLYTPQLALICSRGVWGLAVSSSPSPLIDVSALPQKFYMTVTENDLDPKVRKMSTTFY